MNQIHARNAGRKTASVWSVALLLGCIQLSAGALAAVELSGRIDAKITNPGFIIEDVGGAIMHTPLDDVSTASAMSNFGGPVLSADALIESTLTNSTISTGGFTEGTSAVGVGSLRGATAGGLIDYRDEIAITSGSLPDGTAVNLQFSFFAATLTDLMHDAFGDPQGGYGSSNGAGVRYQFTGNISTKGALGGTIGFENWSGGDHFFLQGEDLFTPHVANGILDPATPQIDYVLAGEVGGTVDIFFRAFSAVSTGVWSSRVGQSQVHHGESTGALAIAFGGSALLPDVTLQSALSGAGYPNSGQANLGNANMALSSFTPIPVPPMLAPFVLAAAGTLASRIRRRGKRG